MQGARLDANDDTYSSSAEVSSIRREKWVVMASNVAILANRNCPKVFCRTDTRVSADVEESGDEYIVLIISYTCEDTSESSPSVSREARMSSELYKDTWKLEQIQF